MAEFEKVLFIKKLIKFQLTNGLTVSLPLNLLPKLKKATKAQRDNYEVQGHFIFWDDIDEIIGVKNLLNGSIRYQIEAKNS